METQIFFIEVLPSDILHGVPMQNACCPVARAVQRKTQTLFLVGREYLMNEFGLNIIRLPKEVKEFVRAFDVCSKGEPFSFSIEIPTQYIKQ